MINYINNTKKNSYSLFSTATTLPICFCSILTHYFKLALLFPASCLNHIPNHRLTLLYFASCLDGKFVLNLFARLHSLVFLLEFFGQSKGCCSG